MIDLSDGLSTDLSHICQESRVGAELWQDAIPRATIRKSKVSLEAALHGGDDYELLFTVPVRAQKRLLDLAARLREPLTRIGRIAPARRGVVLVDGEGRARALPRSGYEHFARRSRRR